MAVSTNIANTFEGGMRKDFHPSQALNSTYRHALNAIHATDEYGGSDSNGAYLFGLTNEQSTIPVADLPGTVVGYSYLEERDWFIFFLSSGEGSEIGYVDLKTDEKEYTKIVADSDFGCSWGFHNCEWLYAEFKNIQPCGEIQMYWSSNCFYYVANIDVLLDENRKRDLKCDDFRLFKAVSSPTISLSASEVGGGGLLAGAYQAVARLRDKDGNKTNWFEISRPVYIGGDNNVGGERTNGSIKITVEQLDTRYNQVELAVISTIKGAVDVQSLGIKHFNSNGITVNYTGLERTSDLNVIEILTKRKKWIRGQDLIQKNGHLLLYKIRQEKNPNLQAKVSSAKIQFVVYKVRPEDAHKHKQFLRGERYPFGIVYHYADQTNSPVFHVPATGGGGNYIQGQGKEVKEENIVVETRSRGGDVQTPVNGPPGEDSRYNQGTSGSSGDKTADTFKGYEWEDEPEFRGMQDDVLDDLDTTNDIVSQTEFRANPCLNCDTGSLYEENYQNVEQSSTKIGDLLNDGTDAYLPDEEAKADSADLKNVISNLIGKAKDKKIKKRKKAVYDNGREPLSGEKGQSDTSEISSIHEQGEDTVPYSTFKKATQEVREAQKEIIKVQTVGAIPWASAETYPQTLDCDGQPIYSSPGSPIMHHQVPWDIPLVESQQKGVPNHYQMDNSESNDTWFYLVGVEVSNVYLPSDDELPKPLDKTRPWSLVTMERDEVNKSIVAKGALGHTFVGDIQGVSHAFPKNGFNSADYFDRHIQTGDDDNHIGSDGDDQYVFYSPDCYHKRPPLIVNSLKLDADISGSGFRHGLYAKGEDDGNPYKDRVDIRGCRQALNINNYQTNGEEYDVSGIGYATGGFTNKSPKGVDRPLCLQYRESCVYLQLSGGPTYNDNSFVADGLNHERELPDASGGYASLLKDNPAQYGRLEGARYIGTGLYAIGWSRSAEGLVGDTFVGQYSIKRTGYISNKIGEEPLDPPTHIYTALQKLLALDDCTRPPLSGDTTDNKNKANGYPNQRNPNAGGATQDVYYPKTYSGLLTFVVESDTNIHKLEIGDPYRNEVHYPNLGGLYLDAEAPKGTNWPDAYLCQFHSENRRPSKWKRFKAAITRIITLLGPLALLFGGAFSVESLADIQHSLVRGVGTFGLWIALNKLIFSTRTVKRFFDIPWCETDAEGGGDFDEHIRGWYDHPTKYCGDFDIENDKNLYIGMPDPYNVCSCDSCTNPVHTNEIYYSNKQSPESQIDAYRNFEANSYGNMPVHAGQIQKLFKLGDSLKAHCTDGLWDILISPNQLLFQESQIGLFSPFELEPREFLGGIEQGIYGSWDPNSTINTPWGIFFIDYEAKELYRFTGGQVEAISNYGMRRFFKKYLTLCTSQGCRDEKSVQGTGFLYGYDPRHDRILFTKVDGEYSFTISYDPKRNVWLSFHSYVPQFYAWDRENMYSVQDSTLWLHNNSRNDHQTFYNQYYPFEIEWATTRGGYKQPFEYQYTKFWTEANLATGCSYVRRRKLTFNKAAFYNSIQSTGPLQLFFKDEESMRDRVKEHDGAAEIEQRSGYFTLNEIRDYFRQKDQPITECAECDPYEEISSTVSYESENDRNVADNHIIQRFSLEDEDSKEHQLIVFEAETSVQYFDDDM